MAEEVGEIKPFSSQLRVFLVCFCLQDLGQACLSLIITQVLFSGKCVFYFHWESLVNRSGGVRRQVNRGRVFHRAWRRVFLACHRPGWMDNWVLCDPSWQRSGPREADDRAKKPRPRWKSSTFHCFNFVICRSLQWKFPNGLMSLRLSWKTLQNPLMWPVLSPGGDCAGRDVGQFI